MKPAFVLLALSILGAAHAADAAKPVDISLATIMPKDTSGHQRLLELRDAWRKLSTQAVRLSVRVGTGDGEVQLVRKLRAGQYQAALMSAVGLAEIDRSVTCLQLIPMQFRDWRELDYVREKLRAELDGRLRAKGFEVLFWADAGWVRYFSKTPAVRPVDFKPLKMFVWTGEPQQLDILRSQGYQPVGLETEQILPSLSTGMINAVPIPPFLAAAGRLNDHLHHMVDVKWVPLVGAAIVRRDVWEKISPGLRVELLKAAEAAGESMRQRGRAEDLEAITALKARGLTVHEPNQEVLAEWQELANKVYPQIRGPMVPADLFDRVQRHVAEYRAANPGPAR